MTPAQEIQAIIDKEIDECHDRIAAQTTPILKREFAKAKRKYRRLKGVMFSMGREFFVIEPKADGEKFLDRNEIPPSIQEFADACMTAYSDQKFWTAPEADIGETPSSAE